MSIANKSTYLLDVVQQLNMKWPENRTINIVCHGHSVPAGYFATPKVDTFNAYPHLLHRGLKERYPFSVINVIVSAIGGESSDAGAARFQKDVISHNPDVITIDYGLNDRRIGLKKASEAWRNMLEKALSYGAKVILLTPTMDIREFYSCLGEWKDRLDQHAQQIRLLAQEYQVALADSYRLFEQYIQGSGEVSDLLSSVNHPNKKGHEIVATELLRWFPLI